MEHAGALHVRRVVVRAGDEVAAVDLRNARPGDRPSLGRQKRNGGGVDRLDELLAAGHLAVRQDAVRSRIGHAPVGRGDLVAPDLPTRRRHVDQGLASGRRDEAQLRPHRRRRAAAERARVPGNEVGVAHDQADRRHPDAQLLGDLLRERGPDVLPHLDLAGEDGDAALGVDREPRGEVLRQLVFVARAAARFLGERDGFGSDGDDENPSAEKAQEASAVEREPVEERDDVLVELGRRGWHPPLTFVLSPRWGQRNEFGAHFDVPSLRWVTDCSAARMRGCVPQRQTLRTRAPTMSSRARLGVRLQQPDRGDDHPGGAVTALERLFGEEGSLNGMEPAVLGEPLDRDDAPGSGLGDRRLAGGLRLAVEEHHARAALALAAAVLRPGHLETVAEDPEEGLVGRRFDALLLPVDGEKDRRHPVFDSIPPP